MVRPQGRTPGPVKVRAHPRKGTRGVQAHTRERCAAQRRIAETPELEPHSDTCLREWPEGANHYRWIATAPTSDIAEWASGIEEYKKENGIQSWEAYDQSGGE